MQYFYQRAPFKVKGTNWPSWVEKWNLPSNVTPEAAIAKHSVPNLLTRLHEDLPLQVAEHRGRFDLGKGVQECSMPGMLNAVSRDKKHYSNFMEGDMSFSADKVPFVLHEFNLHRTCEVDKQIQHMHSTEIKEYELLIRETRGGRHSEHSFQRTGEQIPTCEEYFDGAIAANPGVTIFADARDGEAGLAVAWLSHRAHKYKNNVALLMYSFQMNNVEEFEKLVEAADPAADWRETVAIIPCVFPEELGKLAQLIGHKDLTIENLRAGGKAWIDGFLKLDKPAERMRIIAMQTMMSGVTCEMLPENVSEKVLTAFRAEEAAMQIVNYIKTDTEVREIYPHIKISTGTRSYVYSTKIRSSGKRAYYGINLHSSRPVRWENDERRWIREGYALVGNAAKHAHFVISDRWSDDIAVAEWRELGIEPPLHFRCPHYDTYYDDDVDDDQSIMSGGTPDDVGEDDDGYETDPTVYDDE